MYESDKEEKRCKGVKQSVVKNKITFEDYKTTLFSGKEQRRTMNVIRSHKHEVYTLKKLTRWLCLPMMTSEVILQDGVHTLAHGHWRAGGEQSE